MMIYILEYDGVTYLQTTCFGTSIINGSEVSAVFDRISAFSTVVTSYYFRSQALGQNEDIAIVFLK